MTNMNEILSGQTALGIELGSTRIKAALLNRGHETLAVGQHVWENRYENGVWTYSLDDILTGVRACYADLKKNVKEKYGVTLSDVGAAGISAMMHGYMVFDKTDRLLAPFRTWRNNSAEKAAKELTKLFNYNIPARWSVAHLYQAVLDKEPHVADIAFQTTLAGYIHWKLTGEKVTGIGDASGMFPIDTGAGTYNPGMAASFDALAEAKGLPRKLLDLFPRILKAGEAAGSLTAEGAKLLDPDGDLKAGIPFCPPEGDAGTGMVATCSVKKRTGTVSAGTSIFAMAVLEKELSKAYPEIDLVTTPSGDLTAMVHCNNCTSEINAWVNIFAEYAAAAGINARKDEIYDTLFIKALEGDADCGGVLAYNYVSGENITGIEEGRPMLVRTTESRFNLANLMRAQLYSALATLRIGLDILLKQEKIKIDSVTGHGGIFKTQGVFQRFLAAAIGVPVTVTGTANEGGPWGMAVLALYMLQGRGETLSSYLDKSVFAGVPGKTVSPDCKDAEGIDAFIKNFKRGLPIVKTAVRALREDGHEQV